MPSSEDSMGPPPCLLSSSAWLQHRRPTGATGWHPPKGGLSYKCS